MLFMELWLGYTHSLHIDRHTHTHTHTHTQSQPWPFCSLFFFLFPHLLPPCLIHSLTTEGGPSNRALGRELIPSFQDETSLIFLFPRSCHLSVSFSVSALLHYLSLFPSFCPSLYSFLFFHLPHIYIIFLLLTHSLFLPPSSRLCCLWAR